MAEAIFEDMKLTSFVGLVVVLLASSSIACSAGEVSEPTPGTPSGVSTTPISPPPSDTPSSSGGTSSGSQPAPSAGSASDQVAAGQATFSGVCARCHGAGGEGRSAPRLIGLESGALSSFSNAEQVATYAANNMPVSSKTEAYAVVAFLVQKNGIANDRVLDATVAPTITLH